MTGASVRQALNPKIYLVSLVPALLVAASAPVGGPGLLFLLFAAVALIQHAVNLFNDRADWISGADVEKASSWVLAHGGDLQSVKWHGGLSLGAGALLGVSVLAFVDRLWVLPWVLPFVLAGLLYNCGLSYTAWGEWVTGLCYGPGVFGGMWLAVGAPVAPGLFVGSLASGCLAVAVLLGHQPPQIETDRAAGKLSFAVRHGEKVTRLVSRILCFTAAILALLGVLLR